MEMLDRDPLFVALARPQMFAGVTYGYFVLNMAACAELFLIFKTIWVVVAALAIHLAGVLLCLREPRFLDLWMVGVSRCPRVRNYAIWRCNSYRP
jgi:type IV secretion system protein VirB3